MSVAMVEKNPESEELPAQSVIQYWICQPVDQFRQGQHVYEIQGRKYVVIAYCPEKDIAVGMCCKDRRIARMQVNDYKESDRLAHKKDWTFLAWLLSCKPKRPS
jgi:hypothetical protein